jgi:ferredoxin
MEQVERPQAHHLGWPSMDVELDVQSIVHPEKSALVFEGRASQVRCRTVSDVASYRRRTVMSKDVYEDLAAHLDRLPAGFARTDSGVELRILRRLFTPADAELAVHLTVIPEEARVIARRARIEVPEAARRLDELDRRGLIMRLQPDGQPPRYMALQYVLGFWEGQVNRLTPELVEDALEYEPSYIEHDHWRKAPQMRTIPVQKSLELRHEVMPHEVAEELVRGHTSFAVANCICRQAMRLVGQGCEKPEESCLGFGEAADYLQQSGRGRRIGLEETLEILQQAEEAGLVLQPDNAQSPLFICTCCGCCCGILRKLQRDSKPATMVSSPFTVRLDPRKCNGCGLCTKRCQMEAIEVRENKAVLVPDRCIGCGLCVTKCPHGCLSLARKPPSQQPDVPKDHLRSVLNVARARGRLGMGELVRLQIKSKLDRLLT